MIKAIVVLLLTVVSFFFFFQTLQMLIALLKKGQSFKGETSLGKAVKDLLVMVLGQKKVLRWQPAGLMHAFLFWGFLVLFTTIVEMFGEAFKPGFVFPLIGGTPFLAFSQDFFTLLVFIALAIAFYLRLVQKPKRFEGSDHVDAVVILGLILVLMVTLLFMHADRVALGQDYTRAYFLSKHIAGMMSVSTLGVVAEVSYWLHLVVILFFLNWILRGKHLHLVFIIPNIMLRKRLGRGKLETIDLEDENAEVFGANKWTEFSWKQLMDTYACMECGRCVARCPANLTGKELNPKKLHTGIRYAVQRNGKALLAGKEEFPSLVGTLFSEDFFWQCTTCGACVEECPATNEHIDKIIAVRRYMVLMEGKMKPETQQAMKSLETNFNPLNMGHAGRFDWAEGLNLKVASEDPEVDYIYWVGCFGCFDERNRKVTLSLIKIMQAAGLNFAILQGQEKCTGDPARRVGNEYLFQMLAKENVETLNKFKEKTIITQCPHCFNTLKNEYADFGGQYKVMHHTELIQKLIDEKKIRLTEGAAKKIAYHDSCYLGRHNDIYEPPRNILKSVPGGTLLEIERNRSRSFCCGAGGGRMFMEEKVGKRVNVERVEEAAKLKPEVLVSNCPFCLSMFEDGVKAAEIERPFATKDLAEVVVEAMESNEEIEGKKENA